MRLTAEQHKALSNEGLLAIYHDLVEFGEEESSEHELQCLAVHNLLGARKYALERMQSCIEELERLAVARSTGYPLTSEEGENYRTAMQEIRELIA
jgi:DNA/RNA endonuclease G (NUC1)